MIVTPSGHQLFVNVATANTINISNFEKQRQTLLIATVVKYNNNKAGY